MTKNYLSFLTVAAALLGGIGLTGCSDEQTMPIGEGTIYIRTNVSSDVKVESRASAEEELAASTVVWISNSEGVVRKYNGMNQIPASGIRLMSGDYTVKAWAGKAEYASFESRWFEGRENVTLTAGDKKSVEVVCRIANVVTSVKYADNFDDFVKDYTLTVSHKGGRLTFNGRDERKGYFMMPEGVTSLDYVLTASTTDGSPIEVHGVIKNVEPAHEYALNVTADPKGVSTPGAAFIAIEIDETMVEITDVITITTPPDISGYGFDLSTPVVGEGGSIGRRSVYVSSVSPLANLKITGAPGVDDFDFITAAQAIIAEVNAKGIFHEVNTVNGGQLVHVIFEDTYLNGLANRDTPYEITISATDSDGKVSSATLTLRISEAPVSTGETRDVTYTSAVVTAQVSKEVETAGFEYRVKGASGWTYIAGTPANGAFAKGQTYSASLTGLDLCASYEYRAVSGTASNPSEFRADIMEFSTRPTPQLPNAGMEEWVTSGKVLLPTADASNRFWDSGNHGSSTMNKNITNNITSPRHGGRYSAELKSQFVGIGSIGKFAAGNIFIGQYLETQGTDGMLGFGREFDFPTELKLTKLRVWVHYTPGTVQSKGAGSHLSQGATDIADIYVALYDGYDNCEGAYTDKFGCIVRTKSSTRKLFDKNAANVVAYGDLHINATPGSDLQMVEIPLEYFPGKGAPKLISITCSASLYGDYFEGGEGSTLIVDDFELVYEAL